MPAKESMNCGKNAAKAGAVDSAGLAPDAECPLGADQVEWADIIFMMERAPRTKLTQRFKRALNGKKVVSSIASWTDP